MAQAFPKGERRCKRRASGPLPWGCTASPLQGSSWGPAQQHHHNTKEAPLAPMGTESLLLTTTPNPLARALSPLVFLMWATPEVTAAFSLSPQAFSANTRKE